MRASRMYTAIGLFLMVLLALPVPGSSQESNPAPPFTTAQLAQMLAPIALYPDALLSQVLMASTYPIEVVEADRWVRKNPGLKGDWLDEALLGKDWDPSVKALCHFPRVLALMSGRIDETTNIGNAFLAQEGDVMNMVQELRAKAYQQGNLRSSPEQKVIVENQTIIIAPVDPRVIYVPYYNPLYIYGPWWYPAYPPYYWGPSGVSIGVGISFWPGLFFGFTFGSWSHFDWPHHVISINVHRRPRYVRRDRWRARSGPWLHVPRHRRGVAYPDIFTARKYGQYPGRFRSFGPAIRGFPERRGPARIERRRQERPRVERERRSRQRVERQRPARQQPPPVRRQPRRVGPPRQRAVPGRPMRERTDRNIFNRVDNGRMEREWSKRGRMSREGHRDGSRERGRGGRGPGGQGRMRR